MYKGHPVANKLLQKLQQQKMRQNHRLNLRSIRPNTCLPDSKESFVTLNPKKKEMQSETRCTEIQRENRLLLTKITSIMNKRKDSGQSRGNGSLNSSLRKRQFQSMEVENAKMLKRLQERKSDYQLDRFKKEWRKTQSMLKNITSYPLIEQISGKKKRKSAPTDIEGLKKMTSNNPEDFTLSKLKLIGNKKFIITIKFTQNKCVILGDLRTDQELKVIEIDKEEALQFVEQFCGGNVHRMFEKLSYNQSEGSLLLLADSNSTEQHLDLNLMKNYCKTGLRQRRKNSHKPLFECIDYTTLNKQDLVF